MLLLIIFSIASETSSIKTGWNFIEPLPKRGIKKDVLKIGSNLLRKISPPPIITPGLIIEVLLIFFRASCSLLNTAMLLKDVLSISTPNPEKKIKMTAPVIIETLPKSTYQITFVMPASYRLETLPKAETKAISFRELTDMYVVATTFKGKNKLSRFLNYEQDCREYILNSNLTPSTPVLYAYYSPPFLPSFLRKYEVLYSYIPAN